MKNVIDEKEEYEYNLKRMILNMKEKSSVYIPVKEDNIDEKLADFINSSKDPNSLKLLFLREGDGVYQFGSKKVYVKIEKDKILIRVGGGYLSIDQFVEKYYPLELEKKGRLDPVKIFSQMIQVKRTI